MMENPLAKMMEKLAEAEKLGIYVEDIQVNSLLNFNENKTTLTGAPRPAGEYFVAGLSVLVSTKPVVGKTIEDIFKAAIRQVPKPTMSKKAPVKPKAKPKVK